MFNEMVIHKMRLETVTIKKKKEEMRMKGKISLRKCHPSWA